MEHRYKLQPYKGMSSRHQCPQCHSREKSLSLYIDTETGQPIGLNVGRCNREANCGYHYTPAQYFAEHDITGDTYQTAKYTPHRITPAPPKPASYIAQDVFQHSLRAYEENAFVRFLVNSFGVDAAIQQIEKYFIGSSKHWPGAVVFWQIDGDGNIRAGKIMLYNPENGRRVKDPYNYITWAHKALNIEDFNLKQCLFGEHLLSANPNKPVAIVESEKTAIIADLYLPQFIWLSVGSLSNLSIDKCRALKGRNVVLFPDLKGFDKWKERADELSLYVHGAAFKVSDLLERKASDEERQKGYDLADYLIRFSLIEFQQKHNSPEPETPPPAPQHSSPDEREHLEYIKAMLDIYPQPAEQIQAPKESETWAGELTELVQFFDTIQLPNEAVKLSSYETVTDVRRFVEAHLPIIRTNDGKRAFRPYFDRLKALKNILEQAA